MAKEFSVEDLDQHVRIVTLPGRLDHAGVVAVEPRFLAALAGGRRHFIVDMAHVDYVASVGLRLLLTAAQAQKAGGSQVVLVAVHPHVLDVLDTTGFLSILRVLPDRAAAIAGAPPA